VKSLYTGFSEESTKKSKTRRRSPLSPGFHSRGIRRKQREEDREERWRTKMHKTMRNALVANLGLSQLGREVEF
jgi:hypothetical protein